MKRSQRVQRHLRVARGARRRDGPLGLFDRWSHVDDLVHRHRVQVAEQLVVARGDEGRRVGPAVAQRGAADEPWAGGEEDVVGGHHLAGIDKTQVDDVGRQP